MKTIIKNYYSPTPKKWRSLGDALLGVGMFVTGISIYNEFKWVAIGSVVLCIVGKFLTNFFADDSPNEM